jgi:hypothetical protein
MHEPRRFICAEQGPGKLAGALADFGRVGLCDSSDSFRVGGQATMGEVVEDPAAVCTAASEHDAPGERAERVVRGERQASQQSEKKSHERAAACAVFVKMSR